MSKSTLTDVRGTEHHPQQSKKFKGIRRRKWGKWVSEIRVPGTSSRLWLGSYSTAEAAAAAHDVASFYLRSSSSKLLGVEFNFPEMGSVGDHGLCLSPSSVQKAASDAGMAVDAAHRVSEQRSVTGGGGRSSMSGNANGGNGNCNGEDLNISVDDYL